MSSVTLTSKASFKVLVCDDMAAEGLDILKREKSLDVVVKTKLPLEVLKVEIADSDACVVRSSTRLTREVIESAKRLKVIGRAGVGLDNFHPHAAS